MKNSFGHSSRFIIVIAALGLITVGIVGNSFSTRFFAAAATFSLAQSTTCAPPNLQLTRQLTLDAGAEHYFAPGDYNGDGKQDLAVQTAVGKLYGLLGDGAGNFAPPVTSFVNAGVRLQIAGGDVNGDGRLDIVSLSTARLELYTGNGNGSFSSFNSYAINAKDFQLGDFNKDGKEDIAVTLKCCPDGVALYLSNANNTFTATTQTWGAARVSAVADFNRDGNLDIVTSDVYYPSSQVRLGNGRGQFTNGAYLYYGVFVSFFATIEFNGDGYLDLLGVTSNNRVGLPEANSRKLIVEDGLTQFSASYPNLPLDAIAPNSLAVDFNGDAYADLVTPAADVYMNNGGFLCPAVRLTGAGGIAKLIRAADFNGDNKPDLIRQLNSDTLEFYLSGSGGTTNTPPTITLNPTTAAQGSTSSPVFGTVTDAQTAASSLQVTTSNLPAGVTLTNLRSNNGAVTGDLTIGCAVATGTYQIPIRVTDGGGLSATANWALTVGANQAPIVGTYAFVSINSNVATMTPSRAPGDDGTITLAITAPTYAGSVSVAATGVVTITNNNLAGTYTATVTATDNCGLRTSVGLTFTIPATPPTCNVPSFHRGATVAIPSAVALIPGDFNKDGFQDVIVIRTRDAGGGIALSNTYFGDGRGGFNLVAGKSVFDNVINPGDQVKVGDFNSDSYLDLGILRFNALIGTRPQYSGFQTLLNDKTGRITGAGGSSFGGTLYGFEVGDVNNDNFTDLVINTGYNNAVWLNNKNGSFSKLPNEFGTPLKLLLADVNQDGKLDIINDEIFSGGISFGTIWVGDGIGSFTKSFTMSAYTLRLVTDLTRDGRPDSVSQQSDGTLFVTLNRATQDRYPQYTSEPLISKDFNGDEANDLLLADGRVLINDGGGKFCGVADFRAQGLIAPAAAADFNGDGKADILTTTATGFTLWTSGSGGGTTNTPPTMSLGSMSLIQNFNGAYTGGFGTVSDAQTPAANLILTASNLPAGVTFSRLYSTSSGSLNAEVTVTCTAPLGGYQVPIKVTDEGGLSATANLTLNIFANPGPPSPSGYPNTTVNANSAQVTPSFVPPGTTLTVSSLNYAGALSIAATGVVTIINNNVAGIYQATVTATDVCGLKSSTTFSFTILPTTTGCATPTFNAPQSYSANNRPYGLASGDFNGDGRIDLVTTNLWDHTVTLLTNNGNGFTKGAPIAVGILPNYVAAKDLNGDGRLDLTVVNRGSDTVTILLGNGNGTFTKKGDYEVGNKSTGVMIGDFNVDGKLDLLLPNDGLGNIAVLNGNGDGSFQPLRFFFAGGSPQPGVVGDFNGDGRDDVAMPNYFAGSVILMFGSPSGSLTSTAYGVGLGGSGVESLAKGDLNGDGKLDLVITNTTTNQVFSILGDGTGGFTSGGGFATFSDYPASIVLTDFNGDGKLDVAVGGYNNNRVHIFKGLGNGFDNNAPVVIAVGAEPLSLLTNDFNGDGKADLAIANIGSGTVSVLLNGCGQ